MVLIPAGGRHILSTSCILIVCTRMFLYAPYDYTGWVFILIPPFLHNTLTPLVTTTNKT